MKYLALFSIPFWLLSLGCSNATPEVSFLNSPSSFASASGGTFAQGNVAGSATLSTQDGTYTGSVIVHAGNNLRSAKSIDGKYTLQIRKLSN